MNDARVQWLKMAQNDLSLQCPKGERNCFCHKLDYQKGMCKRDPDSVFVEHIMQKQDNEFGDRVSCGFKNGCERNS